MTFSRKSRSARNSEKGYILLTLLLTVTLMTIAAMAVLPDMIFELKREREEEMIHRGCQYTRAIRAYYRKLGRYPTRLEDLDNSNNLRFLRKHYKDPLTGKDFKLLHYGDPGLQLGGGFGSGTIAGANTVSSMNGSSGSSFGNSSGFGNSGLGSSGFGNSSFGNSGVNNNGVFSQSSSFGSNSSSFSGTSGGFAPNSQSSSQQTTSASDADSRQNAENQDESSTDNQGSDNQKVFGGMPIVGVASTSKKKTIRIFNKKSKYNEWQFIYDPTADRGGLIKTPYQTPVNNFGSPSLQPGQSNTQNNSSPFGNSNGNSFGGGNSFGSSSGFGQPSSGFGGFTQPNSGSSSSGSSSNPPQ